MSAAVRPGRRIDRELVQEMYSDYLRVGTITYVASKYKCDHKSVVRRFRACGFDFKRPALGQIGRSQGSYQAGSLNNEQRHSEAVESQVAAAEMALPFVSSERYRAVLELRMEYPGLTLAELAERHDPPLSKDVFWGRFRRALSEAAEGRS